MNKKQSMLLLGFFIGIIVNTVTGYWFLVYQPDFTSFIIVTAILVIVVLILWRKSGGKSL